MEVTSKLFKKKKKKKTVFKDEVEKQEQKNVKVKFLQ